MIAAHSGKVFGLHKLQVGEAIVGAADAIGSACGLDRINRCARRTIADYVEMQIETCQMHALGVFHDDLTIILELAMRNLALPGVIPMSFDEHRHVPELLTMGAHVLAKF